MDTRSRGPRALVKKTPKKSFQSTEKLAVFKKKTYQVQNKTLDHSVRSLLAVKEQSYTLKEDSQALLNEDLFKLIDINNRTSCTTVTKSNFQEIDQNFNKSAEKDLYQLIDINNDSNATVTSQSKSIFQEIDTKYDEITRRPTRKTSYLISDADLKKLVAKKYSENKNLILNPWERNLQNFLTYARAGNFSNILFKRIVANQSKINACSVVYELDFKFRDIKLAETFVKRKFVRRYNELSKLQNLNADIISPVVATDLIREARLGELPKMSLDVGVEPLKEAEKSLDTQKFPKESFRTPEKQKYKITDFSVLTNTSLTPVVKTKISLNYLENLKDTPANNRYIFDTKKPKKQNMFTEVTNQYDALNLNTIFDRPKKVETLRKDRKKFSFEYTSPKSTKKSDFQLCLTPNRKLDFCETKTPDFKQTFDFVPLDTTPKRVDSWLEPNFPKYGVEMTRKRSLMRLDTPEEIKIRRMENLGQNQSILDQIPKLKSPDFKYGRNYFF